MSEVIPPDHDCQQEDRNTHDPLKIAQENQGQIEELRGHNIPNEITRRETVPDEGNMIPDIIQHQELPSASTRERVPGDTREGTSIVNAPIRCEPDLVRDIKLAVNVLLGKEASGNCEPREESRRQEEPFIQDDVFGGDCQGEETVAKELAGINIADQGPDAELPDRDPSRDGDKRRSEGEPEDAEGAIEMRAVEEGQAAGQDEAAPIPNHEAMKKENDDDKAKLQDKFEWVIERFTNITEFKKFARASNGLRVNESDISNLQDSRESSQEQMISMLYLWQQNNDEHATCERLQEIVDNYRLHGPRHEIPQEQNANADAAPMPGHDNIRMEDVFPKIISAFASMAQFKKFARSSKGLRLRNADMNDICSDWKQQAYQQKLEMLKLWLQNTKDATPQMITDIKCQYLNLNK